MFSGCCFSVGDVGFDMVVEVWISIILALWAAFFIVFADLISRFISPRHC